MERISVFMAWKINIIKMSTLLKAIYRFNAVTMKITMAFFTKTEKTAKMHTEPQRTSSSQSNLEEKKKGQGWKNPHFLISNNISIVIKTVWFGH